jgi:hypothetical protein
MSTIATRVACARWDDHRYFGHGALSELLGHETFLGLTFIAATGGRRPTPEESALLDALAVSMAAADPRIWPLKITRLAAAYGGTLAGFVAGQLCTECDAIGPWVTGPAAELLVSVQEAVGPDADDGAFQVAVKQWLGSHGRLSGYGVAFRADDERFMALRAHVERCGRAGLPYWKLQERLSAFLFAEKKGLKPNIALGAAALLLDMSLSPREAQAITNLANVNTFYANALEGAQQRSRALQELPVESVKYVGRPPRRVGASR